VGAGEITAARVRAETFVLRHLDADLVVLAVENVVLRNVGDGILVAQLVADVLERLI